MRANMRSPDTMRANMRSPDVARANMRSPNSGHSRQASLVGKTATAFPTTVKAKKLGFFKRKPKQLNDGHRLSATVTAADRIADLPGKNVSSSGWMSGKKIKKKEASATAGGGGGGCAVM